MENYRLSLISSLSKIIERIIFNRMYNFANKQKILYEKQFGFQKKNSCVDALIEFTEFIREGWDKKLVGQSGLVDLKKAFDTIIMIFFWQNWKNTALEAGFFVF